MSDSDKQRDITPEKEGLALERAARGGLPGRWSLGKAPTEVGRQATQVCAGKGVGTGCQRGAPALSQGSGCGRGQHGPGAERSGE